MPCNPDRRFGATYSDCGLYRYRLWRAWGAGGRTILWVMLNPSTADHLGNNDPTIERCERRSVEWGYSRMEVVNLFALRSPYPDALRSADDPVGPGNDRAIRQAARRADAILCAWGALGGHRARSADVLALLARKPLLCLGRTARGEPAHPLYLPYDRRPLPFDQPAEWK